MEWSRINSMAWLARASIWYGVAGSALPAVSVSSRNSIVVSSPSIASPPLVCPRRPRRASIGWLNASHFPTPHSLRLGLRRGFAAAFACLRLAALLGIHLLEDLEELGVETARELRHTGGCHQAVGRLGLVGFGEDLGVSVCCGRRGGGGWGD